MNLKKHLKQLRKTSLRDDKAKGYGANPKRFFDPYFPWFKVITYKTGSYLVIDRYSGDEQYIGQTITFYRKRPVYGLNYYGILLDKKLNVRTVYNFLKKALTAQGRHAPHRGLHGFKEDKFLYHNTYTEKRGFVEGEEKNFYKRKLIYVLVYHGGLIEDSRSYGGWSSGLLSAKKLKKEFSYDAS